MKQKGIVDEISKEIVFAWAEAGENAYFGNGFRAGVNSKVAERIKIEYAIGILHELLEEITVGSKESKIISNKFQQLQNQLNDGK